jgi:hypothetical protein
MIETRVICDMCGHDTVSMYGGEKAALWTLTNGPTGAKHHFCSHQCLKSYVQGMYKEPNPLMPQ